MTLRIEYEVLPSRSVVSDWGPGPLDKHEFIVNFSRPLILLGLSSL